MTDPLDPHKPRQYITLLLAQPPDPSPALVINSIEGGRYNVEALDLPELPAWQTRDLDILLYRPPWIGPDEQPWRPLTPAEADQQQSVAIGMVRKLIDRLRQNLDVYIPLRIEFHNYWAPIIVGLSGSPTRSGSPATDIDRILMTMLVVFDLAILVTSPDLAQDSPPVTVDSNRDLEFTTKLGSLAPEIRMHLRQCLEDIGCNPDYWLEMVLFGLLLHPLGMVWVRDPVNFAPSHGGTELERAIELAIGVPDTTYRSSNKVHRAYRKSWGVTREPERPGPKLGGTRHPSPARQKFENYVLYQSQLGASAYAITQDNEAQRLYGEARRDHAVVLKEQAIRRILRNHANSKNSP